MKHRKDTNLILLLSIVIGIAAVLSFIGVKGAEHLVLKSHAEETAVRWGGILSQSDAVPNISSSAFIEDLRARIPKMQTALVASGIVRLSVFDSKGAPSIEWHNLNFVSNDRRELHIHSLWGHLNPFHPLTTTLVSTELPLIFGGRYIHNAEILVDLTGVARHMETIGNLAFISMLGVLGFISLLGGILVTRNVQYRREQAVKLSIAKETAEKANRSKSDFLANVSHELRSPLNSINGFSEIMANEMFGPLGLAKYKEYSQDIHESGELLLSLINDILDLSKAESGHMELQEGLVDIHDLVLRIERLIIERAGKAEIRFKTKIQEKLPHIQADEQKLLQIFLNLITNAIKFTPPGGTVTLIVEHTPGHGMTFTITDTGIGVDDDDISKVLEPFSQVNDPRVRQQEGTGLGLPLSKRMVELHDGVFEFNSRKNIGTTVTVKMPDHRIRHARCNKV